MPDAVFKNILISYRFTRIPIQLYYLATQYNFKVYIDVKHIDDTFIYVL